MRHFIALFIGLFFSLTATAENWIQIESKAAVVVDGTYIITFRNDEGYFHTMIAEWWNYAGVYQFKSNNYSDATYKSVSALENHTMLFRIEKHDDAYYLFAINEDKYVSNAEGTSQSTQFLLKDTRDEACKLSIEREGSVLVLKFGDRYFQHNEASSGYKLKTTRSKDCDIELYRLDDGTVPEVQEIDFDTDEDFITEDFYGTVKLHRTFKSDEYNTLILPFSVEDYRVFGSDLSVFELKSVSKTTITFYPVESYALKSNTFYLMKGTFTKSDFAFKERDIKEEDTQKEHRNKRGSIAFRAKYQAVDVGGTDNYILFKGQFYRCSEIPAMKVYPTRWYISSDAASGQAPLRLQIK